MSKKVKKPATRSKHSPKKKRTGKSSRRKQTPGMHQYALIGISVSILLLMGLIGFRMVEDKETLSSHKSTYAVSQYSDDTLLESLKKIEEKSQGVKQSQPEKPAELPKTVVNKVKEIPEADNYRSILEPGNRAYLKPVEVVKEEEVKSFQFFAEPEVKPKVALIIDDVHTAEQVYILKSLPVKVTPSIFPPSEQNMQSHLLAKGLDHYMIHLPMESGSAKYNMHHKMLKVTQSLDKMEERVLEIRRLFPNAKYTNNHTGSTFTDNYEAMYELYGMLKKEGFVFIDSRTIGTTKVPQIAREYGDRYIGRDVFIDNVKNVPYIHDQLKKLVEKAEKNGYAIGIGHPHEITIKALAQSSAIFDRVELVYIDELLD